MALSSSGAGSPKLLTAAQAVLPTAGLRAARPFFYRQVRRMRGRNAIGVAHSTPFSLLPCESAHGPRCFGYLRLRFVARRRINTWRVLTPSQPMKFLFYFNYNSRLALRLQSGQPRCGVSFTPLLTFWAEWFWVFIPIHLIWNLSCVEYVRTHTKRDCLFYMRQESMLVGLSIIHAIIISILPTIAAIVLLSLLEVWTKLETHWLHTWLFVACVVYNLSRGSGKRRMAVPNDFLQSDSSVKSRLLVESLQSMLSRM
jgi:hypothetical protein